MNTQNDNSAVAEIADEYDGPELNDALLHVCAGYSLEEARTFFPATAGVLEDAWRELAEQYDADGLQFGTSARLSTADLRALRGEIDDILEARPGGGTSAFAKARRLRRRSTAVGKK